MTVAPQVKGAVYTIENNPGRAAVAPVIGQTEGPRITTAWVIFRYQGWVAGKWVFYIGVDRIIVTLHLPVAGYRNVLFCTQLRVKPRRWYLSWSIKQDKLPLAIQVD